MTLLGYIPLLNSLTLQIWLSELRSEQHTHTHTQHSIMLADTHFM